MAGTWDLHSDVAAALGTFKDTPDAGAGEAVLAMLNEIAIPDNAQGAKWRRRGGRRAVLGAEDARCLECGDYLRFGDLPEGDVQKVGRVAEVTAGATTPRPFLRR
jgi:hypothetical protein